MQSKNTKYNSTSLALALLLLPVIAQSFVLESFLNHGIRNPSKVRTRLLCLNAHQDTDQYGDIHGYISSNRRKYAEADIDDSEEITLSSSTTGQRWNRRQLFSFGGSLGLAATATSLSPILPAYALSDTHSETQLQLPQDTTIETANLDCLRDLPPIPTDYCRIFLCRHGQTENNRLRLVQGARLNPPINDIGRMQAQRMGLALSRADPCPTLLCHSPLKRAQQTAEEANRVGNFAKAPLQSINPLMEVDFGPVAEGQPVKEANPKMMATYTRWAFGDIDYRPEGGGDSARDVSRILIILSLLLSSAQ